MPDLGSDSIPSRTFKGVSMHRSRKKGNKSIVLDLKNFIIILLTVEGKNVKKLHSYDHFKEI